MSTITRIDTCRVPPRWLFVRVETADGAVGWGEASLEGHAEAVEGAFAALRDRHPGVPVAATGASFLLRQRLRSARCSR